MSTTRDKLDALVEKLRTLPEPQQQAAVEALTEIAAAPYPLSADELAVLAPALARAAAGEHIGADEVEAVLRRPWG